MPNDTRVPVALTTWPVALYALGAMALDDGSAEAQSGVGEVFRDRFTDGSGEGPQMVVLPPGIFTMGSPVSEAGRIEDEGPQWAVEIGYRLAMGRYEVTVDQYEAFVMETGHSAGGGCHTREASSASWLSPGFAQSGHHPVACISWDDAQAYVDWLNRRTGLTGRPDRYRLPSEAEWEYAVRAGTSTAYSFGDDASELGAHAWYAGNSDQRTHPVGSKPPNAFGLYDMHGHVWEWVEDCWNWGHTGAPTDGSARTTGDCSHRVHRGGSWYFYPQILRSAHRGAGAPGLRDNDIGFRLARTLPD